MPIITPAYHSMCATHNVTSSTQMIMTQEFKIGQSHLPAIHTRLELSLAGGDIVNNVIVGSANWSELFAKHDFFHKYRHYLQVIASTGSPEQQIKWSVCSSSLRGVLIRPLTIPNRSGTVESRIRQLVMKLEFVESLTLAHPFTKGFMQTHYCLTSEEVHASAHGEIPESVTKRKEEDIEGKEGASTVYSTTFYIGLAIEPKQCACHDSNILVGRLPGVQNSLVDFKLALSVLAN